MTLDPGISASMLDEYPEQKVTEIRTGTNSGGDIAGALALSTLHPVEASELVRDMNKLRG